MEDDSLDFCDDTFEETTTERPWKVLVVDDDPGVHAVTDLVMHGFSFEDRPVELWHSYSGMEAKATLSEHSDFALIFLDVVMETEEAGLEVVTYLRESLNNHLSRIVLRTGQAGRAPEEQVIRQYDINDYKEKSDLTERKLKTVFFSSLRNYRDLLKLEHSRENLRRTIEAIAHLHGSYNLLSFASSLQEQVKFLITAGENIEDVNLVGAYAATTDDENVKIMVAEEGYHRNYSKQDTWDLPSPDRAQVALAFSEKRSRLDDKNYLGFSRAIGGGESVLHLEFDNPISTQDQEYLSLFVENALITYESLLMDEEIKNTQRSTVLLLGEAVEKRSQETGRHVQRVSEISAILAREVGLSDIEIEQIRQASPLHDVGKIGIPDAVLNKPGKHTPEEWELMKTHTSIGRDVLSKSKTKVLELASIIAYEHHECWNGSGYPRGLKETEIHIAGRIVAIADVMDALVSKRCYKVAWPFNDAFEFLTSERHKRFDPQLVDIFLTHKQEILTVYERLKD